jgi:response regulator of citrate/malate metabolism
MQLMPMVTTVNLEIPIESLIAAIDTLVLEDQQRLLEILEQKIFEAEEANYAEDAETTAEIKAVQAEYEAGDFVTFDHYLASHLD